MFFRYPHFCRLSDKPSRPFQTITSVDPSTGNLLPEEFQYQFDTAGRTCQATFAMTPQAGYTPSAGASFYDPSHTPTTRGRAYYAYDGGGRTLGIYHWWDTFSNGAYTSSPVRANECTYEVSGLSRGVKTQNKFYNVSGNAWNLQRTETYGYDPSLDYLTSANYGDGLANASVSWSYDDAGNRASDSSNPGSWSYDNLDRLTGSPGVSVYTNDILGNRTQKGVSGGTNTVTYGWDENRLTSLNVGANNTNTYVYRADGMRVSKVATGSASSQSSVLYRRDGQTGIEDVELNSSSVATAISRYGIGARGIDAISRTVSSGTNVLYPLYDAHGNNVGLLSKSGAGWSVSDERSYDAWGQIRSGSATGSQTGRYCANLGHRQDDESGLVYMSMRYFEPSSGRFLSEDVAQQGSNWYTYCKSDPVNLGDRSGNDFDLMDFLLKMFVTWTTVGKAIARATFGKLVGGGFMAAGRYLMRMALILIGSGQSDIKAGEQALDDAAFAGGSMGQIAGASMGGVGLCIGGAMKVAFGVALYFVGMMIMYLGEDMMPRAAVTNLAPPLDLSGW